MSQPAISRLDRLVAEVADRIPLLTDVPYALYGHSMGALIAFELAREVSRRQGNGPEHLFVSGCRAPQVPRNGSITFNLPHDEFLSELKRLKGTPQEVLENPELIELFIDVLRADFEVVETYQYRPGPPLVCPITVYGGLEDEHVSIESCHAWQKQTSARCKVRMFKGDHFFVRNAGSELAGVFRTDALSAIAGKPLGTM